MRYEYQELGQSAIEIIDGDRGKNYPNGSDFSPAGHCLFLNAKNVTADGFSFSERSFISQEKDNTLRKGKLIRKDTVLTTRGTVGNVAYFSDDVPYPDMRINSGMVILRPNPDVFDSEFVYWLFRSSIVQNQILQLRSGTAQPQLPISSLQRLNIPIPSMDVQKIIVAIIGALQRKIELNQKIDDNLQQQAYSYFVQLFIENENPLWRIGTISDLGTVVGGGTPSKSKPEYYAENGIAWITPKDLSVDKSKFISHGENDISELGYQNSSAKIMPVGTVLFSSRAPIGYIAIASNEVTTNQGFKSVIPYAEIGTPYVYYFLLHNLPLIESKASGSTFKEVSGSVMKSVEAVVPDTVTLAKFNDFCRPLFEMQAKLELENRLLADFRNSLLPKLMSGEIDVSDMQR